jgi:hypothetical protein
VLGEAGRPEHTLSPVGSAGVFPKFTRGSLEGHGIHVNKQVLEDLWERLQFYRTVFIEPALAHL